MAATGYTPIQLYRTATSGAAPVGANLANGELAINYNTADMALYAKNSAGTVKLLMNNPAGLKYPTADGTAGQVVSTDGAGNLSFSSLSSSVSSISFGSTGLTPATATSGAVTVAGTLAVANGGTGSTTAAGARTNLSAASSGANSDITSITGLTTALSAPQGGTGYGTYVVGDILYASTTSALSKLADVATGNALISGGVGAAPSWGKIGLTTHVSGTLPVANGGTGLTTTPANGALDIGNGTGFTRTTLTAGSNITITNAAGSITIASSASGGAATQGGFRSAADALYSGWGMGASAGASVTTTANRIYYEAFQVGQSTTFTKIGIQVLTAQATKVARLGIYNWSGGKATTRVLDAGTVSLGATGVIEITISQTLSAGIYALALIADSSTADLRSISYSLPMAVFMYGMNDTNSSSNTIAQYESGTGTTLPATATTTPSNAISTVNDVPLIFMRV